MIINILWKASYLYLNFIPSSDIRDCPTSFFFDTFLVILRKQIIKVWKYSTINYKLKSKHTCVVNIINTNTKTLQSIILDQWYLCLRVITGYNVPNGSEGRNENRRWWMTWRNIYQIVNKNKTIRKVSESNQHSNFKRNKELTSEAPQVVDRHLPGSQPESYHWGHLKGRREPSMHQWELLHHSDK